MKQAIFLILRQGMDRDPDRIAWAFEDEIERDKYFETVDKNWHRKDEKVADLSKIGAEAWNALDGLKRLALKKMFGDVKPNSVV